MKKTFVIAFVCMMLDQLIKILLINFMNIGESIVIIKNFFDLTLALNTGAAFSLLSSGVDFLIIISIIVLLFLSYYIVKSKNIRKFEYIVYGILIGGIIGNLIDRIIRRAVVDYLSFNIFGYAFPIFNFADMCIVISMILFLMDMLKEYRHEISSR